MHPDPEQPALGSLLGLALGDAMGRPTEFLDTATIADTMGPWRALPLSHPAKVTDDTQMALAVADALEDSADDAALDPAELAGNLARRFVEWANSPDNDRDPGQTCMDACAALGRLQARGLGWQLASQADSKGCGANMRVTPIGLHPDLTAQERAGAAQLQAAMTHGHPTALAASDLTAHAVHLLATGTSPRALPSRLRAYAVTNQEVYHHRWLGGLWKLGGQFAGVGPSGYIAAGWRECLNSLDDLEAGLWNADPDADPCESVGEGWTAEEALAGALLCFLQFPHEPVTAIRRAAASTGDSDSIAALAGALAGAHMGAGGWPEAWVERIEYADRLAHHGAVYDAASHGPRNP
ncbi:ADP-ribosylglycohydrolase family protein [Kitasatospora sp. NPDC088783]|uniref:ADP-ribosylglycohydrolase family protein n=1 Tax=Kitasatospora sp. NPDC088783 TaxID=3364077 RepID=UPI00381EED6E